MTTLAKQTLFVGGKVITVDAAFSLAQAVLVAGERILAVGTDAEVRALAAPDAVVVPLNGATLMPGFVDTHGHLGLFGLDELKVSLTGATSKADMLARIAERVRSVAPGEWIVTMPIGDPPYFLNAPALQAQGQVPLRAELDAIAPHNPVYIQAPTNRVPNFAVLNSLALHAAGITATTQVSAQSRVELATDGTPTGVLTGALQPLYNADPLYQMVERVAPATTYDHIRDGIAALAPQFAAGGTTTLLEAHLTDPAELRAYAELHAANRLPVRVFYTFEIDSRQTLDEIAAYLRTVRFAADGGFGTQQLKVIGVSIGLDGPYWHGAAAHGQAYMGPFGEMVNPDPLVTWEHYRAILALAAGLDFRIHAEAAGRASIAMALKAFAEIDAQTPIREQRYVIEHVEFPTLEQIQLCAQMGVAPTTSTNFIWGKGAEVYQARLGPQLAERAIPMRDWLDAGVPIAQSTDWGPRSALFTLWQSLARHAGLTGQVVGEQQQITRAEAIRAFTINGAWALKMETEIGSIVAGKRADLVVLSGDLMACAQDDIKDLQVVLTMLDGQVVYRAS